MVSRRHLNTTSSEDIQNKNSKYVYGSKQRKTPCQLTRKWLSIWEVEVRQNSLQCGDRQLGQAEERRDGLSVGDDVSLFMMGAGEEVDVGAGSVVGE